MRAYVFSFIATLFLATCVSAEQKTPIPLQDGEYLFEHKHAEAERHNIRSITVIVKIKGNHIVIINNDRFDVFPNGVLEEGILMWHEKSGQWIIGDYPSDRELDDVGGCTDGPAVIDLVKRIYWTC